jgi:hypothetical protein
MNSFDASGRPAVEVELRESKDRIAIEALELCSELHIRAMVGGDPVLSAHGLLSPNVSRNASLMVDPASIRHLHSALLERGWENVREPGPRILPAARLMLTHPMERGGLILYSVIPGFFADPEETFDRIWERHKEIPLRGVTVRALGRLTSAILASRAAVGASVGEQRSNFEYFVGQFRKTITEAERPIVVDLIHSFGGCAEMSLFLQAIGAEPCEFELPTVAYVQWRLTVTDVSDQTRRALALLELAPHGREMMYRSKNGRPRSFGEVVGMVTSLPSTTTAIFGSRRRATRARQLAA